MHAYETATTRLRAEETGACALVQDLLPLYLEGEVSAVSREQISQHLASCERCAGFLAGAQSVRAQLRRDQGQRAASLRADQQPRGAVLYVRELLGGFTAMLLCLPGGLTAALIGTGLDSGDQAALAVGVLGVIVICALLLGLARVMGPLTSTRTSTILGGVALGGAAVLAMLFFSSTSAVSLVASLLLGLAGLVGVWSGVARDGRLPLIQGA
jgi:anti-sigma factor RsiW